MDEPYDDLYDEAPKQNIIKSTDLYYKEPTYNNMSVLIPEKSYDDEENNDEENIDKPYAHSILDLVNGTHRSKIDTNIVYPVTRRKIKKESYWTSKRITLLGTGIFVVGIVIIIICLSITYTIGGEEYDNKYPKTTGKVIYVSSSLCDTSSCQIMAIGFEYNIYDNTRIVNTLSKRCTTQNCSDMFRDRWTVGKVFNVRYNKNIPHKYKIGHNYEYNMSGTPVAFVIIGGFMFAIGIIIIIR
jgi:hypothetical protein